VKVLVTGSGGYIGVLLASVLLGRGHEVVGIDTGFYRDGWLYDAPVSVPKTINEDVRNLVEGNLRGLDAVVHLAELSNDPLGQLDPDATHKMNYIGSVALAKMAKRAKVPQFIYSSSCSVYGIGSGEFMSEESDANAQTAYAKCKVLVERDVGALADDNFSPTFLRNATAYGASPRMRFDLVLNNLAGYAWTSGEIKMTSDGTPWRPLVHVMDICHAFVCTLEAPRDITHNQVFNVGHTKENYRVKEVAEIISNVFPGCRVSFGADGKDNRSYRVLFDKIHSRIPNFRLRMDAASGARELRELFHKIALSREAFEFRGFTRVRQLEYLLATQQIDQDLFWTRPKSSLGQVIEDKEAVVGRLLG